MQLQLIASADTKQCRKCGAYKVRSEFHRDRGRPDGLFQWCKACANRSAAKNWSRPDARRLHLSVSRRHKERRRDFLTAVRETVGCSICPETAACAIDFHHIDPSTKSFSLSRQEASHRNWDELCAELRKCTGLCANCHRKLHAGVIDGSFLRPISEEQIETIRAAQ